MEGYELINSRRLNNSELSRLNTDIPGYVGLHYENDGSIGCKLYAKGSTTQFHPFKLDPASEIREGQFFDLKLCEIREYRLLHTQMRVRRIYVPKEAIK